MGRVQGLVRGILRGLRQACFPRSVFKGRRGPERTKKNVVRNPAHDSIDKGYLLDPARELPQAACAK